MDIPLASLMRCIFLDVLQIPKHDRTFTHKLFQRTDDHINRTTHADKFAITNGVGLTRQGAWDSQPKSFLPIDPEAALTLKMGR